MKTIARYGMMLFIVALAAAWRGWNDGWFLIVGLITVVPLLVAFEIWRYRRAARPTPTQPHKRWASKTSPANLGGLAAGEISSARKPGATRGALAGTLLGIVASVLLMASFSLCQQLPWLYNSYYDADRTTLEAKLSTLEQAGNHEEAAATIEDRLTRPTGRSWRGVLAERLYHDLVRQAGKLSAEKKRPMLARARELALEYQFDDTAARTLQEQAMREMNLADRLSELKRLQDWSAVIDVLKSELLRNDTPVAAQLLYDALCTAAVHSKSTDEQTKLYAQAMELGKRHGLPVDRAQAALALIQLAQDDQKNHQQRLADVQQESVETRRVCLEGLVAAAMEIPVPDARLTALRRIATLASEHRIELPLLQRQIGELDETLAKQRQFAEQINQLRRDKKHDELIALLVPAVKTTDRRQSITPLDSVLLGCLVDWCDAANDSRSLHADAQRERLQRALAIAKDCGMEASILKQRLAVAEEADKERIRMLPIELLKGAKAGIGKVWAEDLPFVIMDVWVEGPDGAPFTGLQSKDFAVSVDGKRIPFVMRSVAVASVPARFALVVDVSGSVAPALNILKTGVTGLAVQLAQDKSAQMKLIPFNAEVNAKHSWTSDAAAIGTQVATLKADGGTALYRALSAAAEDLGRQPLPCRRHLVLFTDGKDSEGGVALEDVLVQCRAKAITISVIGLRTDEFDAAVLQRLAKETGGTYFEASSAAALGAKFVLASRSIRQDRYRLVLDLGGLPVAAGTQKDLSVTIGRGTPLVLAWGAQ